MANGRLGRLCLKELRESLRDRRTLITLILMPILVYPLLSMAMQR
jgi:ABC-2 type transport system permease protein/sodium transport system permease protein